MDTARSPRRRTYTDYSANYAPRDGARASPIEVACRSILFAGCPTLLFIGVIKQAENIVEFAEHDSFPWLVSSGRSCVS